jgi:SAM-dependent methyltransferase
MRCSLTVEPFEGLHMNANAEASSPSPVSAGRTRKRAEFDGLADDYEAQHKENVSLAGEEPEYFSQYKIADLARFAREQGIPSGRILDFGSGIGNSLPYFRKYFPNSALHCADVSARSMEIARTRFPGAESFIQIRPDHIPVADQSQDIVFSACVFHHIPHEEHVAWLRELLRITRVGGALMIYEHNPLNPLTVRAVNTCPFDANARLIAAGELSRVVSEAGWRSPKIAYRVFFPSAFAALRPLEPQLGWLFLGAQYRLTALCPL